MPPIKTVIYLDVLLLTNFALTLLFLLAAGLLAGVECRAGRLLLGGAAGAASSLALLAPEAPEAAALLYKVSTAALTVAAAFGWPGGRCFARLVGWFCAGNLLLAGTLLLPGAQSANLCLYLPLSPGRLLAACAAVYALLRGVVYCFGRAQGRSFAAVLVCGSARVPVQAFCDTGFAVQDPLSGRAVALAYYPAVRGALPGALQSFLDAHFAGRAALPPPGLGVRLVPCTTLAGPCLLPAVPGLRLQAGQRQAQGFLTAFYCPAAPPDHWTLLLGPELAERVHPL